MNFKIFLKFNPTFKFGDLIDKTKKIRTNGTYRIYPAHCAIPTIPKADKSIIAATELVRELNASTPSNAAIKCRHAKAIQQLTAILTNTPFLRVGDNAAPRVERQQSSSIDHTNRQTILSTKYVHQRRTRNNTPPEETASPEPSQCTQPRRKAKSTTQPRIKRQKLAGNMGLPSASKRTSPKPSQRKE